VAEKLMSFPAAVPPLFVLSKIRGAVIATGPVIPIVPPAVVTSPFKLMMVEPVYPTAPVVVTAALCVIVPAVAVNDVKGVEPPTTPEKLTTPAVPPRTVKEVLPLTVLEKLMSLPAAVPPLFVLSKIRGAVIATGPVIPIVPPAVVTSPFKLMMVEPVYPTAPVVVTAALWVIVAAVAVNDVKGVEPPTIPERVIIPVPASKVSVLAPLSVSKIVILAPVAPALIVSLPARVTNIDAGAENATSFKKIELDVEPLPRTKLVAVLKVNPVKGVSDVPTESAKVIVVPAVRGREKAPVMGDEKVIAAPAVTADGVAVKTTASLKRIEPVELVILLVPT
jgi:hypothetical protein